MLNQVVSKSLITIKFLIAASFLGPEKMGIVGFLLIIYAISETLSEFGLTQAVVQSKDNPKSYDLDSVWWSLALRGIALALILLSFGYLYPIGPIYQNVFLISAAMISCAALLKSLYSPKYYLAQRNKFFSRIFVFNLSAAVLDLFICIYLLQSGNGLSSIFFALLISELLKFISSFFIFGVDYRFFIRLGNINFNISKYIKFGKWVWLNNCNVVILNQSDKFLSGAILGMEQLGLYQMGSRISQTATNDVAMAASNYLFPTLSRMNTGTRKVMHKTFSNYFCYVLIYSFITATSLILLAPLLVVFLGEQWDSSIFLLQILAVSMAIGALVTTMVPLIKAQGTPRIVTRASFIQLLVFLPTLSGLGYLYGINGVAFSTIISYSVCLVLLIPASNIPIREMLAPLGLFFIPLLIYLCVFIICFFIKSIFVTALLVFLNILTCVVTCLYIIVSRVDKNS